MAEAPTYSLAQIIALAKGTTNWYEYAKSGAQHGKNNQDDISTLQSAAFSGATPGWQAAIDLRWYVADTSSSTTTYTGVTKPTATGSNALFAGYFIIFKPATNNTGASTLNVASSNGAVDIKKISSGAKAALAAGDLDSDTYAELIFDGTDWIMLNAPVIADLVGDTSPQLGGNLDLNSNDITGTGGINLTGTVETATLNLDGTAESSPAEGDIWYDSGKFYLGTSLSFTGVWSSGGNLATARAQLAGAGTQSAGLCMGGYTASASNVTEEYDGTSWSAGGNLGTARRQLGGAGTQSAGLCMGGYVAAVSNVTEEYDGTSWSAGGNLATARKYIAGAGTQTAGLCMGGKTDSVRDETEEYDGTSWSAGGNLGTARSVLAGAGTQSAGLCMGGYIATYSNVTEEYNGTAWSAGGNLGTARTGGAGAGTQSAGLCMGGDDGSYSNVTEEYDGTSWSSGGNLATARQNLAGAGTQTVGLCMGGTTGSDSNVTEEYNAPANIYELFTASEGL